MLFLFSVVTFTRQPVISTAEGQRMVSINCLETARHLVRPMFPNTKQTKSRESGPAILNYVSRWKLGKGSLF